MRNVILCLLIVTLSPIVLFAQRGTTGTISGVVTDQSRAVVPRAKVTATNTATGTPSAAYTNSSGFYSIPNLVPGPYRLDLAATGFESYEQTGIVLQVNGNITVNATLKVGSTTAKITVSGAAPLVDTRDQTLSFAITPQFTEQLPLNGRNILQLMALAPDTSPSLQTEALQGASRPEAAAGFITASGEGRGDTTTFYLDGGLNMDTYTNVANVFPNPDAVQEFTFETNSINAKYGGMGGGVVNAVTRGGTNQFHGSAFEYLRNGALNGRNFFAANQDTLKRNQFGGSLGGPIQKDKTFAFFSFQRTTLRYGTTTNVAFGPTTAELAGDWSAIPTQLYNDEEYPNSTQPSTTFITNSKVPFPNNQIPTSLYVPLALKILKLVPRSTLPTGQIFYNATTLDNDNQYVARVDRNFGERLRISGTFLRDTYVNPAVVDPTNALTAAANNAWPSTHGSLNLTYSFGPSLMTTLGATLSRVLIRSTGTHDFTSLNQLGANFPNWLPSGELESSVNTGWFCWLDDNDYDVSRNQYDFNSAWTYVRGNHMLEFGGEYVISQSILSQDFLAEGYPSSNCAYSGYSPVDFMLGQNCMYQQNGLYYDDARGNIPAAYVNDTWRVKHGVTLSLGVRWNPWRMWPDDSAAGIGMIISPAAFAAGIRSTVYPNLPPGLLVRGDPGVPNTQVSSHWKLFEPRIGLAWDVKGNGKTSVRVGVGLYHDQPFGNIYNDELALPYVTAYMITDPTVPWYSPYNAAPFNGVLPSGVPPNSSTPIPLPFSYANAFTPSFKPEQFGQWNFTIEHQLGEGFLLRTSYEGSETWNMPDSRDINTPTYIPGTDAAGNSLSTVANEEQRRPWYPDYGGPVVVNESTDTSSYNALNITLEKRMPGNLSVLGGYRWAKCMDEGSLVGYGDIEYSDERDTKLDRGVCKSDLASQFKMTAVYQLPSFNSLGFAGRNIVGGWTMSGIFNWDDGFPYSIISELDSNEDTYYNDRALLVGNPNLPGNRSTAAKLQEWFNTAGFQNPPIGMADGSARDFLRGPGYFNLDYSLIKSFPIRYGPFRETQKLDFRAEFFNLFNHPNFGLPDNNNGDLTFGQILSTAKNSNPRIIQFALKYIF